MVRGHFPLQNCLITYQMSTCFFSATGPARAGWKSITFCTCWSTHNLERMSSGPLPVWDTCNSPAAWRSHKARSGFIINVEENPHSKSAQTHIYLKERSYIKYRAIEKLAPMRQNKTATTSININLGAFKGENHNFHPNGWPLKHSFGELM